MLRLDNDSSIAFMRHQAGRLPGSTAAERPDSEAHSIEAFAAQPVLASQCRHGEHLGVGEHQHAEVLEEEEQGYEPAWLYAAMSSHNTGMVHMFLVELAASTAWEDCSAALWKAVEYGHWNGMLIVLFKGATVGHRGPKAAFELISSASCQFSEDLLTAHQQLERWLHLPPEPFIEAGTTRNVCQFVIYKLRMQGRAARYLNVLQAIPDTPWQYPVLTWTLAEVIKNC